MPLDSIGLEDIRSAQLESDELLRHLAHLNPDAAEVVKSSMAAIALRALEMAILCDQKILDMSLNPTAFLGADEELLRQRTGEIFGRDGIPEGLLSHLLMQIRSGTAGATKKVSPEPYFRDVLDQYPAPATSNKLRCQGCGYHFVEQDLGEVRRRHVEEAGLTLASEQLARRIRDPWKPAKFAECTLDHVVPEAGLGGTQAKNLRILCNFCNYQKQIYRWPGETIGRGVASSFLALGDTDSRGHWAVQAATFTAIQQFRACFECGAGVSQAELTATTEQLRGNVPTLPWSMRCVCYDCFDPAA